MSQEYKDTTVLALIGKKVGMSQVFDQKGRSFAVSVVAVEPNLVVDEVRMDKRNYEATALGVGEVKKSKRNRTLMGRFASLKAEPKSFIREIRNMRGFERGAFVDLKNNFFEEGDFVDVSGTTKGKGFAGAIKRHGQTIGPRSHGGGGGSKPIRQVGSIGDITGNKVFKGMNMPGIMGGGQNTTKNLTIAKVVAEEGYLLISGAIPGPNKGYVLIKKTQDYKNQWRKNKNFVPLVWNQLKESNSQNLVSQESNSQESIEQESGGKN